MALYEQRASAAPATPPRGLYAPGREQLKPASSTGSLEELRQELAEVERMIRLLEWATCRPRGG